ncbi:sialidase family protein [Congregibacter sp.]|uniref:sialidase family protein n=1 Tax=Congregibacter sp. TaxID=2744308 RepID=UPI00385F80D0
MTDLKSLLLLSTYMAVSAITQAEVETQTAALELQSRTDHLDTLAREPMIVQHPDGALFVSGYPSQVTGRDWTVPPLLWRSDDDGKSWKRGDVGSKESGAQGNSDVDLSIGPKGTLYMTSMGFNRETRAGTHIAIGASVDAGETWNWQFLSQNRLDDRPWVAVGENGTAHAIWNGSAGVSYTQSINQGAAWSAPTAIAPSGGSSHLAVGTNGRLAVRVSPIGASANTFDLESDYLLVSNDDGATWTKQEPPGRIEWDPTFADPAAVPRWVEPLAWTADGSLHHVWSEGSEVKHGVSKDLGETWQISAVSTTSGIAFYPFLTSNGENKLAATWFVKDAQGVSARLAQLNYSPHTAAVEAHEAAPFVPDAWEETVAYKSLSPAGEYIPVSFLANGDLAVVSPVQNVHDQRWGFTFWRFSLVAE